jgi:hypothetical protein
MGINSHLSTCVGTQSPKYLEMAQGHISLSVVRGARFVVRTSPSSTIRARIADSVVGIGLELAKTI